MDLPMTEPAREQSRARYPDSSGYTKRDGVRLYYEVYGSGEPTVFLLPTWSIIHSRHWKMQIPYLARHCRVLTFDGRGNGRSDRPAAGYGEAEFAADALAVMDATATERAMIVSLSVGAQRALILAAEHPDRVTGAVFICPAVPLASPPEDRTRYPWDEVLPTDEGWAEGQPLQLAAGLPRLPGVLLLPDVHRAALDQADRRLHRLGPGDHRRDPHRDGDR